MDTENVMPYSRKVGWIMAGTEIVVIALVVGAALWQAHVQYINSLPAVTPAPVMETAQSDQTSLEFLTSAASSICNDVYPILAVFAGITLGMGIVTTIVKCVTRISD